MRDGCSQFGDADQPVPVDHAVAVGTERGEVAQLGFGTLLQGGHRDRVVRFDVCRSKWTVDLLKIEATRLAFQAGQSRLEIRDQLARAFAPEVYPQRGAALVSANINLSTVLNTIWICDAQRISGFQSPNSLPRGHTIDTRKQVRSTGLVALGLSTTLLKPCSNNLTERNGVRLRRNATNLRNDGIKVCLAAERRERVDDVAYADRHGCRNVALTLGGGN